MSRLIFHIDVNSAFLSWEATRRVSMGEDDIRLIPSAIGGDREKRTGVILAKSIPAKKFGIKTGEPVAAALRKCPDLFLARPDFKLYEASSHAFITIVKEFAPVVEQVMTNITREETVQFSLFPDEKKEKARKIDKAKDALNAKFGSATVVRGSSIQKKLDVGKKYQAQIEQKIEKGNTK